MRRTTLASVCAGALAAALVAAAPAAPAATPSSSAGDAGVSGLNGPRGLAIGPGGRMVASQANGEIDVIKRRAADGGNRVFKIGKVPKSFLAPAVDVGPDRTVWALTVGADSVQDGAGTLYRWRPGHGRDMVLNVQRWQGRHNHDPFDLEKNAGESNPYGVAGLADGSALVADAANNSLIRVFPSGRAYSVARVKPRTVKAPDFGGAEGMPPPGTPMPAEAVVTSVTVGADGAYYIGELRGFPATPGTSSVWRIKPGAKNAVCDPAHPRRGACKLYAGGFTSIVSLASGENGAIYVAELSKMSWMALESGDPAGMVGAVIRVGHDRNVRRELAAGKVMAPGGVAVGPRGGVYVAGPVFGPGMIRKIG
jgi:hypothetical protein